jgi:hypothetical protein
MFCSSFVSIFQDLKTNQQQQGDLVMKKLLVISAVAILGITGASAQGSVANPLHKQESQKPPSVVAAAPNAPTTAEKPKRERSAKQKQSDQDMKTCGSSWSNDKDALKAKGETWRSYLKTCRAQLKSTRGA